MITIKLLMTIVCLGWAAVGAAETKRPTNTTAAAPLNPSEQLKQAGLPSSAAGSEKDSELSWYDASLLTIEGKGFDDTATTFSRLPATYKQSVTPAVWGHSLEAAGICVRFVTDATTLAAVWDGGEAMNHMAATGKSGLDLYVRKDGDWVFHSVARPKPTRTLTSFGEKGAGKPTEYLLYLPLYSAVTELKIGIEKKARIAPAQPRRAGQLPVVFYGTSITQGGCASRAGMGHVTILGRWLDRDVINLGFSGSGKMEPAMADVLSEIECSLYVLECLPNMDLKMVKERYEPFVHQLRKLRPDTPILMVENPVKSGKDPQNQALRGIHKKLKAEGIQGLHYLEADGQFAGKEHPTVDGVHPTDLGFYRMAEAYFPVIRKLLQ